MRELLRSTAVRLALGYAMLFIVSSLLLTGFLWWRTTAYLDREIDAVILADGQAIADRFRDFGLAGAVATIEERVTQTSDEHAIYLMVDPTLRPVAGNLQAWPLAVGSAPGWHQIELVRDNKTYAAQSLYAPMPGGFRLLVARDVQDRVEIRSLVVGALIWAALGSLILASIGGLLVRRGVLRRVETINRTATAIVQGDFSQRVPTQGSSDEFDRLARTVNTMLAQIQGLVDGVRNASNVVAHDLRTPLAELRARLEGLLRSRPPAEAAYEEVQRAVADIDRIVGVFNALLRLADIDSGVRRSGFRPVDLTAIAAEIGELYEPLAEEKELALKVEAAEGSTVVGDPDLIAQAIGNLVDNAIKYVPNGGAIALRIAPDGPDRMEIAVSDNGPGIPDAEKPSAVERFYRGQRGHGPDGIGLGLSVADAIARLHGGVLSLRNNHPGLIVALVLPKADGL
jgi:signal transduction histidine kinase